MAVAAERRLRLLQGQAVNRRHDGPAHLGDQHGRQEQGVLAELDAHQRHGLGRSPGLGRLGIWGSGQAADRRLIEPADIDGDAALDRQADGPRPGLRQRKGDLDLGIGGDCREDAGRERIDRGQHHLALGPVQQDGTPRPELGERAIHRDLRLVLEQSAEGFPSLIQGALLSC